MSKFSGFWSGIKDKITGILFVGFIAIIAAILTQADFIQNLHLSILIIGILCGVAFSWVFTRFRENLGSGVAFSGKRLLRLGIILFGFNISVEGILELGFSGILIAFSVVCVIFSIAYFVGVRILKLDRELSMLIGAGSAVCGAAAVLAMESVLKSQSHKGILALASVVVFGLLGMFIFPLVLNSIDFLSPTQKGIFLGASLHEVANVIGAAGALVGVSDKALESAVMIKMLRVIMLVPLLFVVAFFTRSGDSKISEATPWFAILFLCAIAIRAFIEIPLNVLEILQNLSKILLVFAMIALGLQIDFGKIKQMGKGVFSLALVLFVSLMILAGILVKILF